MSSNDPKNIQIWQAIVEGDTQAFALFVDEHKNLVTSIAYSITGDLAGSEDIAQEAFLVSWQSRNELKDARKVVGWLSSIARNLSKQWLRKRSSQSWATDGLDATDIAQEQAHPAERIVSDEEQHLVWNALKVIPEDYREVMVLYYRESHSIADVAVALEITEEAARQRLSRGRNLLRAEVERTIDAALTRSRPTSSFTASVISLVVVGSSSTIGKAATTATLSVVCKSATQGTLLGVTQTAASGAMLGAAGGLLGAIGGLGGTWLGIRVPQLMAPTMTERRMLEREGRVIWRLTMMFIAATFASLALALLFAGRPNGIIIAVLGNMLMGLGFAVICIVRGIRLSRQIQQVRLTITPEQDPNPTWLKDRLGVATEPGKAQWVGRRVTSRHKLLGWPLLDIQVSDPTTSRASSGALHAKGWIAVGDKATGLVAIGSVARGALAMGGLTIGLVSFGGFSIGLVSVGGAALGLLSIGGFAIGHSAIGGGAVGWQAAGGGAVGIYSANGGLAIAGNIAEGGLAISKQYAVGGEARAPEANTDAAREQCAKSWVAATLGSSEIRKDPAKFQRTVMIYGTALPVAISMLFALAVPTLMYQRKKV